MFFGNLRMGWHVRIWIDAIIRTRFVEKRMKETRRLDLGNGTLSQDFIRTVLWGDLSWGCVSCHRSKVGKIIDFFLVGQEMYDLSWEKGSSGRIDHPSGLLGLKGSYNYWAESVVLSCFKSYENWYVYSKYPVCVLYDRNQCRHSFTILDFVQTVCGRCKQ